MKTVTGVERSETALSRRDFLKGTAVLGATAVGGMALAGCAAEAEEAPQLSAAEAAWQKNVAPIAPVSAPEQWDGEADVVVVGLGGGGLAASLRLAQAGKKVIALEKLSHTGGNTQETSTFSIRGGSRVQNATGKPFDPQAIAQLFYSNSHNSGSLPMILTLVTKAPELIDWLEEVGVPWEIEPVIKTGVIWQGANNDGFIPRSTKLVSDLVYEQSVTAGVDFRLETPAAALVMDGERVVGVKATSADGAELYFKGEKGVILTAGGFAYNRDMLKEYCPTAYEGVAMTASGTHDTGEVIRMGFGAGAAMNGYDSYFTFDGGLDVDGYARYLYGGDIQLIRQPFLGVNVQGVRYPYFHDHAKFGVLPLIWQSQVLMAQPGNRGYLFFDADYEVNAPKFEQIFCRKLITPDMEPIDRLPESLGPHDWRVGAKNAIEQGIIKQADTIAELAELVGMDPDIAMRAVDSWNQVCADGVDTELGYPSEWLLPIAKAPFCCAKIGAFTMSTTCGLHVNTKMEVVGTKGKVIPGLYAGGCTAGSFNGESSYGAGCSPIGGNNLSWTTGYIAAESIMAG